jgi:hypothetical protein
VHEVVEVASGAVAHATLEAVAAGQPDVLADEIWRHVQAARSDPL